MARSIRHLFAKALAECRKYRVRYREVRIFDHLHVFRRNHHAEVAERFHLAALETGQTNREGSHFAGGRECVQHVGRIAAAADGKHNIIRLQKRAQLLGEDIVIAGIVCPRRYQGNIVGEGERAEAAISIDHGPFAEVAGAMRRQSGAATIAKKIDSAVLLISIPEDLYDLVDLLEGKPVQGGGNRLQVDFDSGYGGQSRAGFDYLSATRDCTHARCTALSQNI